MDDLSGQTLGPYQVLEQLGAGAMATVYKGYQASIGRYVAIKVLASHLARDTTFRARFQREARTIAQLEHRSILPIYDFGEHNGTHYLVMRYIDTGTLSTLLSNGALRIEHAIPLISQVGEALAYAHQKGVIHRDIKPSNILFGRDGNVFLADFGIAKVVTETIQLTGTGEYIGTHGYMSPEQHQGKSVDARTDIYALGVVLYQTVTGELPFVAENAFSVALMHVQTPPPRLRQRNPTMPEALEAVILRALEKNPADRFQSAGEMVAALGAVISKADALRSGPLSVDSASTAAMEGQSHISLSQPLSSPPLEPTIKASGLPPVSNSASVPTVVAPISPQNIPEATSTRGSKNNRYLLIGLVGLTCVVVLSFLLFRLSSNETTGLVSTPTENIGNQTTGAITSVGTDNPYSTTIPTPRIEVSSAPIAAQPLATLIPEPTIIALPTQLPASPLALITSVPEARVGTTLKLREGPGEVFPSLGSYNEGTALHVIGKDASGQWLKVETPDGRIGWMFAAYLQVNIALANVPSVEAQPTPQQQPAIAAAPTRTPRPAEPPAQKATPEPTSPSIPTPNTTLPSPTCSVPLTGGFGRLWQENAGVREHIGCPLEAEQGGVGTIAEQPFEHGSMFYYDPLARIYVFFGINKGTWRLFEQKALADIPTPTPADPPVCAGRLVRGFGLVWGSFADVREALGCATQPEGGLFEGAYELFKNGVMLYSHEGLGRGKTLYVLYSDGSFERYDDPTN